MTAGTLLFSGTDLASLCTVNDLNEFWSSSDVRGDLPVFEGVNGARAVDRAVAAKVCSGQVTVVAATATATEDAVAAVKAVLRVNRSQTLTRRKVIGAGTLDATQTAIVRTAQERWVTATVCTLLIGVELVDGVWYGASTTISSGAGVQTIAGETSTSRMTVTLDPGAARTVANQTNGYSFTFLATVPTGGVLVDVVARTATAITGGADMSQYLNWSKNFPLRLDPGSQTLATDASTFSISYQPAYL